MGNSVSPGEPADVAARGKLLRIFYYTECRCTAFCLDGNGSCDLVEGCDFPKVQDSGDM